MQFKLSMQEQPGVAILKSEQFSYSDGKSDSSESNGKVQQEALHGCK